VWASKGKGFVRKTILVYCQVQSNRWPDTTDKRQLASDLLEGHCVIAALFRWDDYAREPKIKIYDPLSESWEVTDGGQFG
jgi:hypothetical protein